MNVLGMTSDQRYYKPSYVNATSVSPSGGNPNNMTAGEIVERVMGRKAMSGIPIELFAAIGEAKFYGESASVAQLNQSLHNLRGSILLQLKEEAEEGTLKMDWIKKELKAFDNPIPNYTPNIPPLRHPENIVKMTLSSGTENNWNSLGANYATDTLPQTTTQGLKDHASKAFMKTMGKKLEMQQELLDTIMELGASTETTPSLTDRETEILNQI